MKLVYCFWIIYFLITVDFLGVSSAPVFDNFFKNIRNGVQKAFRKVTSSEKKNGNNSRKNSIVGGDQPVVEGNQSNSGNISDEQIVLKLKKMANSNYKDKMAANEALNIIENAKKNGISVSEALNISDGKIASKNATKRTKSFGCEFFGFSLFSGLFKWIKQMWLFRLMNKQWQSSVDDDEFEEVHDEYIFRNGNSIVTTNDYQFDSIRSDLKPGEKRTIEHTFSDGSKVIEVVRRGTKKPAAIPETKIKDESLKVNSLETPENIAPVSTSATGISSSTKVPRKENFSSVQLEGPAQTLPDNVDETETGDESFKISLFSNPENTAPVSTSSTGISSSSKVPRQENFSSVQHEGPVQTEESRHITHGVAKLGDDPPIPVAVVSQ